MKILVLGYVEAYSVTVGVFLYNGDTLIGRGANFSNSIGGSNKMGSIAFATTDCVNGSVISIYASKSKDTSSKDYPSYAIADRDMGRSKLTVIKI